MRKLEDYYLSILLSLSDLVDGGGSEDRASEGKGRAVLLMIMAHVANVAALVYLVLPPARLHALAYNLAVKNRVGLYILSGLLFGPYILWVRAALRKKRKELAERKSTRLNSSHLGISYA